MRELYERFGQVTIYLFLRSDRGLPQLYNILLFMSLLQYPNAAHTERTECVHTGKDLWTERNIAGEICVSLSRTWTINLTKKKKTFRVQCEKLGRAQLIH